MSSPSPSNCWMKPTCGHDANTAFPRRARLDFIVPGANVSLRFAIGYAIGEPGAM